MLSKFTLSMNDHQLSQQYLMQRNKEIVKRSILLLIARIIVLVANIITLVVKEKPFVAISWIVRVSSLLIHFLLILVTYKYPRMTKLHSPILTLLQQLNFYLLTIQSATRTAFFNNVMSFNFYLLNGFLTSSCWIFSTIGFVLIVSSATSFYTVFLGYEDIPCLMQHFFTTIIVSYSCY